MPLTLKSLRDQRQRVKRAWAKYVRDQELRAGDKSTIAKEVRRSWARSSRHLNPHRAEVPVQDQLAAECEWRDSLLYRASAPLLTEIKRSADASGYAVGICDGGGKLLWTYSSPHMARQVAQLNFIPGGLYDEASAGTNAFSLALKTVKPVTVFSAEHYVRAFHDWVCYSAPIRDPGSGLPLGVIDFSSTWKQANALGPITVSALARHIEARVAQLGSWDNVTDTSPPAYSASSPLDLRLLGRTAVYLKGEPLKLSPRQLEVLALLALHPEGLSLDSLHTYLYGAQEVSFSTLKAEVSVLRGLLGGAIGSRPYRLELSSEVDALKVQAKLEAGEVRKALKHYGGSLLPGSDAPRLREWRAYLDEAVRQAVLQKGDPDLMWRYGALHKDDFDLLLELSGLISQTDPRQALIKARLRLLSSESEL